jgi:hypothetical protein
LQHLHPLLSDRAVLVAAIDDLLALAREYGALTPYSTVNDRLRDKYLLEAARLGMRLLKVQQEIESDDLD